MEVWYFIWGVMAGGVVGGFITALFVIRETRKDELFYKDCIRNLRNQLVKAEEALEELRTGKSWEWIKSLERKKDEDTKEYPGIV